MCWWALLGTGRDLAVDSGFDIREIRFTYDNPSDTAYFGACQSMIRSLSAFVGNSAYPTYLPTVAWPNMNVPVGSKLCLCLSLLRWQAFAPSASLVTWTASTCNQNCAPSQSEQAVMMFFAFKLSSESCPRFQRWLAS
jgi:hypothetical protein